MVYAVVWGYAIVGVGLNFQGARMTIYISSVVLTIGLSTLLQAWVGHRMAMLHGVNVIPSLAIVAAFIAGGEAYPLQSFPAQAIAGIIILALVYFGAVRYIRKVWSPLSLGSMIIMIGLTVAQVRLTPVVAAAIFIVLAFKGLCFSHHVTGRRGADSRVHRLRCWINFARRTLAAKNEGLIT